VKLKLDENIGTRGRELLVQAGHDVATVAEQELCSASDPLLIQRCREEQRGIVTLDRDFSNPLIFNPSDYPGISVLRLPRKATHRHLLDAIRTLIGALERDRLAGKLWIVEIGRIRIYQQDIEEHD
jgi:predicted nuclease of predicted toxin-antitoxin system